MPISLTREETIASLGYAIAVLDRALARDEPDMRESNFLISARLEIATVARSMGLADLVEDFAAGERYALEALEDDA